MRNAIRPDGAMTRLSRASLSALPSAVERPGPRGGIGIGIVHFGPGAFHRAHQAAYVDRLLDHDPRWGIAAVSMRSRATVASLAEQDGLYTLAIRDAEPGYRVIDAHRAFLAPAADADDAAAVMALLAAPATRLVTSTVTEKGYCLLPDGTLDLGHPDIAHDAAGSGPPRSLIGWLVAGLERRRAAGLAPFVPMPCDNLADNGAKLHRALAAFARTRAPDLADWIEGEVRVPSTMVDAITPATDAPLEADVAAALGVTDHAVVQRERFAQWVIEDIGGSGFGTDSLPDLAGVGAIVTGDVAGYERAKLRILNGAHSTLAYAGLLRGHASVADAMGDVALAGFVDSLIADDVQPTLPPVRGLDLDLYRRAVLARFRNPAIVHRLEQIAQDGSQKLPYRWGDTLIANRRAGRIPAHVVAAYGAWVAFLIGRTRAGVGVIDPAADALAAAVADATPLEATERLARAGLGLPPVIADDRPVIEGIATVAVVALEGGPVTAR